MTKELTDARETLRFAIFDGLIGATNPLSAGPGDQTEAAVKSILESILKPDVIWALKQLVCTDDQKGA